MSGHTQESFLPSLVSVVVPFDYITLPRIPGLGRLRIVPLHFPLRSPINFILLTIS